MLIPTINHRMQLSFPFPLLQQGLPSLYTAAHISDHQPKNHTKLLTVKTFKGRHSKVCIDSVCSLMALMQPIRFHFISFHFIFSISLHIIIIIIRCYLLVVGQLSWISSCSDIPLFLHIHYTCVLTILWCFSFRKLLVPTPILYSLQFCLPVTIPSIIIKRPWTQNCVVTYVLTTLLFFFS